MTETNVPTNDHDAITAVIDGLMAAGYTLTSVYDGADVIGVATKDEALDAITAVDDAHLQVAHEMNQGSWVRFVLGNDPIEVVADHGVSLEDAISAVVSPWWK